jgi:hypothetical protein
VRYVPQVPYSDRSIGAYCSVAGSGTPSRQIDLGAYLIDQGWAVALPQAPFAYHTLEEIAKVNGRCGAFRPIVSSDSGAGALAIHVRARDELAISHPLPVVGNRPGRFPPPTWRRLQLA